MRRLVLIASLLVALSGCGSDDGDDGAAEPDATQVESTLRSQLASGAVSGRVVDLDTDPPRLITCTKDAGEPGGWRCTVKTRTGRTMVCLVGPRAGRKQQPAPLCGPVDY